ncbi:MAG: SPOR domain-containing protein [Desulfobacterium sp.]|nr:SPOR domain-containing protein [Desulfobacterium sp.]
MDLKIRVTLISVFLICLTMSPALARGLEYEIQFGAFLIQDNAESFKTDLREIAPDAYLIKINTSDNKLFYSVRIGPYAEYDAAVSERNALKAKNASLESVIMERETLARAVEPAADKAKATAPVAPVTDTAKAIVPVAPGVDTAKATVPVAPGADTAKEVPPAEPVLNKDTATVADSSWDAPESESAWEDSGTDTSWGENDTTLGEADKSTQAVIQTPPVNSLAMETLESELDELKEQVKSLLDAEEIRGELTESKDEKKDRDEDILEAADGNYTLMREGGFGFEYSLSYTYYAFDSLTEISTVEHNSNHTLTNTFTIEYPMMDNLTLEASIPFVYEYDAVGRDDSKHVTDFGDVSFGASFQPIKAGGKIPSMIFNTTLTCPMGRSPYEVNPAYDLSTGTGGYALAGSVSLSKAIDPIMAFGTLSYNYRFPIKDLDYKIGGNTLERFDRGDSLGFSVGLGYSVSYITSVTLGYSYSYTFKSKRYYIGAEPQEYQTQTSSSLSIGSSWRLSNKLRVNVSLGIGLGNSEYFSLSFRLPMEFGRD